MQGTLVRSLTGQDDTCRGPRSGKITRASGRLSPSTTTSERMRYSHRSPCALQPRSETGGARAPRLESSPTLQLGRALAATKTQHSQINKLIKQTGSDGHFVNIAPVPTPFTVLEMPGSPSDKLLWDCGNLWEQNQTSLKRVQLIKWYFLNVFKSRFHSCIFLCSLSQKKKKTQKTKKQWYGGVVFSSESGPAPKALDWLHWAPRPLGWFTLWKYQQNQTGLGGFHQLPMPVFRDQTHVQHRRVNNYEEWNVLESDKSKQWKPVFCCIFLFFKIMFQKQNRLSEKLIHQHLRISGRRTHGNSRVSGARPSLSASSQTSWSYFSW